MKLKRTWKIVLGAAMVAVVGIGAACGIYFTRQSKVLEPTEVKRVVTDIKVPKPAAKETAKIVLKQNGTLISGVGASVTGNVITIKEAGTYLVSGTLEDGQILVNAGSESTVILVLQGVELANSAESAIYVEKAGHTSIQMQKGTENIFSQGEAVDIAEAEVDASASGAAVYSKSDLSIAGEGSLKVYGYVNNGIQTKDNLLVDSGNITVEACNNGIKGKDSVTVTDGELAVTSAGDGIQSDNTNGEGYGNITIAGGDFVIKCGADAVQAENVLEVSGGTFDIVTGGGSENAPYQTDNGMGQFGGGGFGFDKSGGGMRPDRGSWEGDSSQAAEENAVDGTEDMPQDVATDKKGQMPQDMNAGKREDMPQTPPEEINETEESDWDMSDESEESRKGFKSGKKLILSGGTFTVDTYDDAIHSDETIEISGGEFKVKAGDDGIHAATELSIIGGVIQITKAYEGIEGNQITLDKAEIEVVSSDDGINAYGGQNSMGGGSFKQTEETPNLRILGGELSVNANGDGLDSNGNLSIEGGTIVVDGPTNSGNGSLDIGSENGGECTISGGTILALGSSGMAEGFSAESEQCSFMHTLSTTYGAGSKIVITDSSGKELYQYEAVKNGNLVIFSSPDLKEGETYTLEVDGQKEEITMDSTAVSNGGNRGGMGGGFKKFR